MTRPKAAKSKSKAGSSPPDSPAGRKRGADGDKPANEVLELEKRRLAVAEELRHVEQQIYDLETKYLENSNPFGNAVRGASGDPSVRAWGLGPGEGDRPARHCESTCPLSATTGYEGYLGGASAANRKVSTKPEERLFSWSSVSGQAFVRPSA